MRTLVKSNRNYPASNFFFDDFFNFPAVEKKFEATTPAVNVKETDNAFIVEVAIPGVKKEDVKVELNENVLSISSEVKKETNEKNEKYTRKEFSYSGFKRSFTVDEEKINTENIEAKFENGILSVNLFKKEKTEPEKKTKTIDIV
jgi:HSP20 family protein